MLKVNTIYISYFILFLTLIAKHEVSDLASKIQQIKEVLPEQLHSPRMQLQKVNSSDKHIIFEETFEGEKPLSNVVGIQTATPHSYQLVTNPVFRGNKAGKFELRHNDPMVHNGTRAELFVTDRPPNKERWYSFAVYFPSDKYACDASSEVISQWWQTARSTQATSLRVREDRLILRTGSDPDLLKEIDLGPLLKDSWQEFVFHFVHSDGGDGLIEVWRDGRKILTQKGGNMYKLELPYWKLGLYKAKWNKSETDTKLRVLYLDNIRVGSEHARLEIMQTIN